jgi:hypothetical protein
MSYGVPGTAKNMGAFACPTENISMADAHLKPAAAHCPLRRTMFKVAAFLPGRIYGS